jgi:plasmid maintenance system antidote protein VapI
VPAEFADATGLDPQVVDGILAGTVPLTPQMAGQLSRATGPSAQFWLNLQHFFNVATRRQSSPAVRD